MRTVGIAVALVATVGSAYWAMKPAPTAIETLEQESTVELDVGNQTVPSAASLEQPIREYADVLLEQIGRVEVEDFLAAGYAGVEIREFIRDNPELFKRYR